MNRYFIFIFVAAYVISAVISPAYADGNDPSAASKKSTSSHWVTVPKAMAGFCVGFMVGIPICFVRKVPHDAIVGARGLVGSIVNNENNPFLLVPAVVLYTPCSVIYTAMEAPVYSWRDAWMAEKPFSKEQFSLCELDSPPQK